MLGTTIAAQWSCRAIKSTEKKSLEYILHVYERNPLNEVEHSVLPPRVPALQNDLKLEGTIHFTIFNL